MCHISLYGICTGEIEFSQKIPVLKIFPCAGEIGFFRSKIPVLGIFPRWWSHTVTGKKRAKVLCSNFMSFSPMELIFIGWVGDIYNFFGDSEISILNTQTKYFQKGKFSISQKVHFLGGMTSKIDFEQNWCYGCVLYYGFVFKWVIHNFP